MKNQTIIDSASGIRSAQDPPMGAGIDFKGFDGTNDGIKGLDVSGGDPQLTTARASNPLGKVPSGNSDLDIPLTMYMDIPDGGEPQLSTARDTSQQGNAFDLGK